MRTPRVLVADRNEALADQIKNVVPDVVPTPEVHVCTRIGALGDVLTEDGPFDVLVSGPSLSSRSGLARLELIRDEVPDLTMMLAFTRRPDAAMRDIIRTGAIDLVQLPAADEDLRNALARALEISAKKSPHAVPLVNGVSHNGAQSQPGVVFTMSSATGGCGKTFLATNLAYLLSHYTNKRACIVDLDLQFGEVSTALRLRPRYTIYDALERSETDDAALQAHIEDYLVTHESGFSVLAAPRDPTEADRIDPPDVTRILEAIRAKFDYVVVDTPAALTEVVLAAFDLSDVLYTMATLDLPSVRNMGVFLGTLERLKIGNENIRLILNKAERDVGINVEQVTKLFPQGFQAVLPYAREVSRSINLGMPVVAAAPQAEISKLMIAGFKELLPEADQVRMTESLATPSRFRLFRRSHAHATT
ncbi:MAG TPA: AAA family ATPase [Acidimicrobiales bacterium]|nr:AAA family ATPase [Acidimicrobiales bacterium]